MATISDTNHILKHRELEGFKVRIKDVSETPRVNRQITDRIEDTAYPNSIPDTVLTVLSVSACPCFRAVSVLRPYY